LEFAHGTAEIAQELETRLIRSWRDGQAARGLCCAHYEPEGPVTALSTEDQLAIQQLFARYIHAIDSGKGDAWAACFTSDGTFDSATGSFAGTQQLSEFGTAFAQRLKARHWITNLVIEPADNGAAGSCYLMLLRLAGDDKPTSILATAIYRDTLVKADGQWKFSARKVEGDA
jgi:hypothetical protein